MNTIQRLQKWYASQCDGDWEHGYGVSIETLDNPGWRLRINLIGTTLEMKPFEEISNFNSETEWVRCWIENGEFNGVGDPHRLQEIIDLFLNWIESD